MKPFAAMSVALCAIVGAAFAPAEAQDAKLCDKPRQMEGFKTCGRRREGRGRRRLRALFDRSRGRPGQAGRRLQQGLSQDQGQLLPPAGRRALRQAPVGAPGQVLPGRCRADLRHGHDPRLPEEERLRAIHLARDGRLQAAVQEQARGLLDVGFGDHGRHRLQHQEHTGGRSAQEVGGPARSQVERCDQRQSVPTRVSSMASGTC